MPRTRTNPGHGRVTFGSDLHCNGVKVFSATMVADRERLGGKITDWIERNPGFEVREVFVTQSSDDAFHCIALTLFYWEELT
ncbi:MAG: hypothetical protein JRF63_11995 [Deltaproteobacteria bacterium]|nr:hypothetical protein [Deltaproteobacteria bacterium]